MSGGRGLPLSTTQKPSSVSQKLMPVKLNKSNLNAVKNRHQRTTGRTVFPTNQ